MRGKKLFRLHHNDKKRLTFGLGQAGEKDRSAGDGKSDDNKETKILVGLGGGWSIVGDIGTSHANASVTMQHTQQRQVWSGSADSNRRSG